MASTSTHSTPSLEALNGVDYQLVASYDYMIPAHVVLLKSREIVIIEALKLDDAKPGMYMLHCLPLRLVGTEDSPVRCILIKRLPDQGWCGSQGRVEQRLMAGGWRPTAWRAQPDCRGTAAITIALFFDLLHHIHIHYPCLLKLVPSVDELVLKMIDLTQPSDRTCKIRPVLSLFKIENKGYTCLASELAPLKFHGKFLHYSPQLYCLNFLLPCTALFFNFKLVPCNYCLKKCWLGPKSSTCAGM
ncbi:hypothetical protein GUJ93_ZPchr0006g41761 [Zizania palustris]|uniref:Uncharacterized protein n=1 Tax=Zizania palustris TaxID=103762 RepID=A0A8J5SZS9_ZIZPA|nr:hypothetical protein GUJ93_ZPchr0006g41761 [Zizania palustris]